MNSFFIKLFGIVVKVFRKTTIFLVLGIIVLILLGTGLMYSIPYTLKPSYGLIWMTQAALIGGIFTTLTIIGIDRAFAHVPILSVKWINLIESFIIIALFVIQLSSNEYPRYEIVLADESLDYFIQIEDPEGIGSDDFKEEFPFTKIFKVHQNSVKIDSSNLLFHKVYFDYPKRWGGRGFHSRRADSENSLYIRAYWNTDSLHIYVMDSLIKKELKRQMIDRK